MTLGSDPLDAEDGPLSRPTRAQRRRAQRRRKRTVRRERRTTQSRYRRWITRSGISLVLLVVVIVAATFGYSLYRFDQIQRIKSEHVLGGSATSENILLIGSTDRCAATRIKEFEKQCAEGVNGINSDVVLVMHLDPKAGTASLLSIPRDTFVPDARAGGLYNKIDAALFDGPDQLAAAIEEDFGIPINHFVELNFATFSNIVNALGGLYMYFPDRLVDASSGLNVHQTGCIFFNGTEALELVRSRHLYWFTKGEQPDHAAIQAATDDGTYYTANSGGQYDGTGDLGRITRVHLFLKALANAVAKRGVGNPITDNALIGAIAPNLTVDSTFGNTELLNLALEFRHVDIGGTPELTAPIVNDAATYSYKGYSYGLVVFPTEPQDQQAIDRFLGSTPSGLKLAPSSISVSVVDGTGSPVTTAAVATALGALGYSMVPTTAANYVGPVSETTVEYGPGHLQQAERVMSSLAGTVVLGEGSSLGGADVSVVAGSDLTVDAVVPKASHGSRPPLHSSAASTASSRSSALSAPATTATTSPTADVNLGAPTSANPPITSYDPRSCPRGSS